MVFALIAFLVGITALWAAWQASRTMRAAHRWPTASGRFLERGVGARMGRASYAPHVKYAYSVGGDDSVGDQFYLTGRVGRAAANVQRLVDSLPDPVPVRYDPANPARSYLLDTPAWTTWAMAVAGVVAITLGLVHLVGATGP